MIRELRATLEVDMPRFSFLSIAWLAAALLTALASPAAAQRPTDSAAAHARLQGVVALESSYEAVAGATVEVVDSEVRAVTGVFGGFALPDAPLGTVWVRVTAPGHPSVRQEVTIAEGRVVYVQFLLPSLTAMLDSLLVGIPPAPQVGAAQAESALELLALEVPSINAFSSGVVGQTNYGIRLRGVSTISGNQQPLLVIDGVIASFSGADAFDILSQIPAEEVEDIEVLRGPAAAFLYPQAANGVIHVKTKR
jgi:hypothetical protein